LSPLVFISSFITMTKTLTTMRIAKTVRIFVVSALLAWAAVATLPMPAHAASLSETQIQAIVGLLQSFNVNPSTVTVVNNILRNTSTTSTSPYIPPPTPVATTTAPIPPPTSVTGALYLVYRGKTVPPVYNVRKEVAQQMCGMLMDWQQNKFTDGSSCIWNAQNLSYAGGFKDNDPRVMKFLKPVGGQNEYIPIGGTYAITLSDQTMGTTINPNTYHVYLAKFNTSVSNSIPEVYYEANIKSIERGIDRVYLKWDFTVNGTPSVVPAGSYYLSAYNVETGAWGNVSAYTFLVPSPTVPTTTAGITLTAPNGGEQWEVGTMNTITWTPYSYSADLDPAKDVNPSRDVTAYLEGLGDVARKIIPSGKASIHWETEIDMGNGVPTMATPGVYYIRIVNNKTGASDRSDLPFTLTPKSVDLKVNGSDGPVTVDVNQPVSVSWTTTNVMSCELYNAYPDQTRLTQVGAVPLSGTRTVYLHPNSGPTLYCSKSDGSARYDAVQINVQSYPASVKIMTPNGGEQLDPAKQMEIYYTYSGLKSVSVGLYWIVKDALTNVAQTTTGITSWIPSMALQGLDAADNAGAIFKIYITGQKADGTGYVDDKSDAPFSFIPQVVSVPSALSITSVVGKTVSISYKNLPASSYIALVSQTTGISYEAEAQNLSGTGVTVLHLLDSAPSGAYIAKAYKLNDGSGTVYATASFTIASTIDTLPPTAPQNLATPAASLSEIKLTWNASTDNVGVVGYRVYRNGVQVGAPTTNSFNDRGLSAATQYSYTVRALDAMGNISTASAVLIVFTVAATPTVPTPSLTMNFSVNPALGVAGRPSEVFYDVQNIPVGTYCSVSPNTSLLNNVTPAYQNNAVVGSWKGSYPTVALTTTTTFTLTCGTVSKSATVTISSMFPTAPMDMLALYNAFHPDNLVPAAAVVLGAPYEVLVDVFTDLFISLGV
jgi:chitodextrinase